MQTSHSRSLALSVTFSLLTAVANATAQTAPPPPPAAAAQPPAPPAPGMGGFVRPGETFWGKSATIGGSFNSAPFNQGSLDPRYPALTGKALGRQGEMRAVQTSLSIIRATNLNSFNVEAAYTYAVQEPIGKVADQPKLSVDYNFRQKDGQRYFFLTRYAWLRDPIRGITYSHEVNAGVGALVVDQPKIKMGLVPVLGVVRAHKGLAEFDDRFLPGYGGLERLIITPNPFVMIEQRLSYQQAFNDTRFRVFEAVVTMKGQVAKHLGIQFSVTHKNDNVLGLAETPVPVPGVGTVLLRLNNKAQTMMTGGVQITF